VTSAMHQGPMPHQLDVGILLEDSGVVIPWGAPTEELARLEFPSVLRGEASIHLTWSERRCFGGLRADVKAIRIFGPPNPSAYHLHLPEFHFACLETHDLADEPNIELPFKRIFKHLENELGTPSWSYPKYESRLPSIYWEYAALTIGYRALAGCQLSVAHEPAGYDELKTEARRIRAQQGDGARVNYIAC
jgi:hypothetical protein